MGVAVVVVVTTGASGVTVGASTSPPTVTCATSALENIKLSSINVAASAVPTTNADLAGDAARLLRDGCGGGGDVAVAEEAEAAWDCDGFRRAAQPIVGVGATDTLTIPAGSWPPTPLPRSLAVYAADGDSRRGAARLQTAGKRGSFAGEQRPWVLPASRGRLTRAQQQRPCLAQAQCGSGRRRRVVAWFRSQRVAGGEFRGGLAGLSLIHI